MVNNREMDIYHENIPISRQADYPRTLYNKPGRSSLIPSKLPLHIDILWFGRRCWNDSRVSYKLLVY